MRLRKAAHGKPIVGALQQSQFLGPVQAFHGAAHRLRQLAQQGRQQLVRQRVLQPPEAGDEGVHPLGKFWGQRQGSRPFSVEDLTKQASIRLRQVLGFPAHHASQGPQSV
jgi:hypothetical protein